MNMSDLQKVENRADLEGDTVAHRIPAGLTSDQAKNIVMSRAVGAVCTHTRLVHHPYAGFVYKVEQRVFRRRLEGIAHVLVDLATGSTGTSDPWPHPLQLDPHEEIEAIEPTIAMAESEDRARQCVVRTALHRRRALLPMDLELVGKTPLLYKPNWLINVELPKNQGSIEVLVDALNSGYHVVGGVTSPIGSAVVERVE